MGSYIYETVKGLCETYKEDIVEGKPLEKVLENRQVRFINPEGRFDYTTFGHFYFDEQGVMLLITSDHKYTKYHRPDAAVDTLMSTVPVIFAGVDTRFRDDTYTHIFTGDVVTAKGETNLETSLVRYMYGVEEPSLMGGNCDRLFSMCHHGFHIEGTVFSELDDRLFKVYDRSDFFWPVSQYYQYGMSRQEVIEKASKVRRWPSFKYPLVKDRGNAILYRGEAVDAIKTYPNSVRTYLCDNYNEEDLSDEEECWYICYLDDHKDWSDYTGETYEIKLDDRYELKEPFEKFVRYAHQHPQKKYILSDFRQSLSLNERMQHEVAMLLYPLYEYHISNVIVPEWMAMEWLNYDCLHNAPCD